ncbi:MAG: hypothetical protein VX642_08860 [Bdellovibrionota bacterium]|nr:hypothetical protein [Bdellovibrionota bacterium]
MHKTYVFILSILLGTTASAQSSRMQINEVLDGKSKFQTTIELDYSLQKNEAGNEINSSTTTIALNYEEQLKNELNYFLKSYIFFDQELSQIDAGEKRADFRDPIFELGTRINLLPESLLSSQSISLQASLASSTASRRIDKKSSLALKYQYALPISLFTFAQYHRITRSFFTKEITDAGGINNPWSYRLANQIIIAVGKSISLEAAVLYDLNQSFQGVLKDGISTDYKIKYSLENFYAYAGVISVGIQTKAADGSSNQLRFIDEKAPSSYIGIGSIF